MNDLICVTAVEGEPRVLDTELAAALGMARPNDIRGNVIFPNMTELEGFGHVTCVERNVPMPRGGFKKSTAYYLNEEQALLVAMFSRTEKAKEVRATLVRVFAAYRRGDLVQAGIPQLPNFMNPAEAARAWAVEYEGKLKAETLLIEVQAESDAKSEIIGKHSHSVSRVAATLPGVNMQKVKQSLLDAGYFYRRDSGSPYRVYRKFNHLFEERFDESHGNLEIFPTQEGKDLLVKLNKEGRLIKKKGAQKSPKVPAKRKAA